MAEEEVTEETTDDAAPEAAKKPSQKSPLVALLLIVNMAGLGVVAFFQFQFMQMEAKRPSLTQLMNEGNSPEGDESPKREKIKAESLYQLDSFTVNLAQGDGPKRFVRLNAVLKLSDSSKHEEIEARKPQIRDTIISILNSKRPEDLLKKEGKSFLKEEIKAEINAFLVDGNVVDVFYVGFQVN